MTSEPDALSARRFLALFLACCLVAALPILSVAHLPLLDYPNHLARMHILASEDGSAELRRFYLIAWHPVPNLAIDILVPLLARVMPLEWAGKTFFLLALLMTAGGAALLHRALFRRWSAWPLLAFLLLYNRALLWGFANFVFGVGLMMVAAAWWIGSPGRAAILRLGVATGFALALYFAHFFAFGAYGLILLGVELAGSRQEDSGQIAATMRRLAAAGVQFVPAAALFLAAPHSGGGAIVFSRMVRKLDLLFNVVDNYVTSLDIATLLLLIGLGVLGALRHRIALSRLMIPSLALLVAAQIVMPNRILGAAGVDHRMPLILGLVLIAATDAIHLGRRQKILLTAALGALFLLRIGVIEAMWVAQDRALAPMIEALEHLPPGSRVAVAYPPATISSPRRDPPVAHLAAYAAIGVDAFVPTLFTDPGQQPLALTPDAALLAAAASPGDFWDVLVDQRPDEAGRVASALAQYDFILFEGAGAAAAEGTAPLTLRAAIANARLYAVVPRPAE